MYPTGIEYGLGIIYKWSILLLHASYTWNEKVKRKSLVTRNNYEIGISWAEGGGGWASEGEGVS